VVLHFSQKWVLNLQKRHSYSKFDWPIAAILHSLVKALFGLVSHIILKICWKTTLPDLVLGTTTDFGVFRIKLAINRICWLVTLLAPYEKTTNSLKTHQWSWNLASFHCKLVYSVSTPWCFHQPSIRTHICCISYVSNILVLNKFIQKGALQRCSPHAAQYFYKWKVVWL
jgi:hypothetical protein